MDELYRCKFVFPRGDVEDVEIEEFQTTSDILARLEADRRFKEKRAKYGPAVKFVFLYNVSREHFRESEDSANGRPYFPSNLRGRASGDIPSFGC